MAFRARKVFGSFEKRTPGIYRCLEYRYFRHLRHFLTDFWEISQLSPGSAEEDGVKYGCLPGVGW